MAVYIDPLIDYGWKLGPSCHMTADSIEELNDFAVKIGLKPAWVQLDHGMPHYDLVKSRRDRAVKAGAIELTIIQAGERYREYREKNSRLWQYYRDPRLPDYFNDYDQRRDFLLILLRRNTVRCLMEDAKLKRAQDKKKMSMKGAGGTIYNNPLMKGPQTEIFDYE